MPIKCMLKDIILTQILKAKSPCCLYSVSFLDSIWIFLHPIPGESPSRPGVPSRWTCGCVPLLGALLPAGYRPAWRLVCPVLNLCSAVTGFYSREFAGLRLPAFRLVSLVCLFCFFCFLFFCFLFFDAVHENLQTLTQASSFFSPTFYFQQTHLPGCHCSRPFSYECLEIWSSLVVKKKNPVMEIVVDRAS